ncbi:unnamed protein product [Owenia fusiformis]|uniref:SGNH hydrolase-type esterase domain-containing protein n=1 Tax=Owenia fusiformis TaxID=6347 RepID=A0A8S4NBY0_OWEFU|nr:unnamed protein product [Owenia fusiformis]
MDGLSAMLIGHSFVRRFKNYVRTTEDKRVKWNLGLERIHIRYDGLGGRKVGTILNETLENKLKNPPNIVILQIGGNDISNGKRPETVASDIENLVIKLHQEYHVEYILVSELIQRKSAPLKYNENVMLCNRILTALLEHIPFAKLWHHRGIRNSQFNLYIEDGVHYNDRGNYKLYQSYKQACIFGESQLN